MSNNSLSNAFRSVPLFLAILAVAGCASLPNSQRSPAKLNGSLWWVTPDDAHRPIESWKADLDALQALDISLLVLNGPFVGEDLAAGQTDPMEAFFAEADRRHLSLYLDTLSAPNWWTLTDPAPEVARARTRIQRLQQRYGKHPSFSGWYIPYELYVFWGAQADLLRTLYRDISAACKEAAPTRPVLISPFFILDKAGNLGDFRWATPEEYQAFWTETLRATSIDCVALQDSGEHLSCYTLDDRRPFFAAMKNACKASGKTLWANVEMGELDVASIDAYVARFGRKTTVNDPVTASSWRGVPAEKLRGKLRLAGEYCPTAISWGYREFVRPSLGPTSAQLYQEYHAILAR
ncbi:MAG: DUF4434 domain-containing protein [Candidatus Hydrogenedentes bacterium]|nr:DUF4434 domain-containing protein [Candidatus Hydrogenedentota bacterium]